MTAYFAVSGLFFLFCFIYTLVSLKFDGKPGDKGGMTGVIFMVVVFAIMVVWSGWLIAPRIFGA